MSTDQTQIKFEALVTHTNVFMGQVEDLLNKSNKVLKNIKYHGYKVDFCLIVIILSILYNLINKF